MVPSKQVKNDEIIDLGELPYGDEIQSKIDQRTNLLMQEGPDPMAALPVEHPLKN